MKLHPGYEVRPTDPNFMDMEVTPLTEAQATYYLREAWYALYGLYPSLDSLAILWAQTALETGRWKLLRCNNWGNIKKNTRYSKHWTSYDAGEFLNGKHQMFYPYHPQTFFAAWTSAIEGASGYLEFLSKRKRYSNAWIELIKGDPVAYCRELKAGGYFTAPLDKYTALVVRLCNEFKKKSDALLSWCPPTEEVIPDPEPVPPSEDEPTVPDTDDVSQPTDDAKVGPFKMIGSILSILKKFIT